MQTDKQAKEKSKNFKVLLSHTSTYSLFMAFGAMFIYSFNVYFLCTFYLAMLITHTFIDYITSRINSSLWAKGKVHDFFVSIGFDQWLHYVALFLSIHYIYE